MLDFFSFGCIHFFSSFFCSLHSFGESGAAICFTKAKNVVLLCILSTSFYVRYTLDKSQVKVSSSRRSDAWCLFHMFWTVLLAGCVLKRSFEKEISPPCTSGNVDGQLILKHYGHSPQQRFSIPSRQKQRFPNAHDIPVVIWNEERMDFKNLTSDLRVLLPVSKLLHCYCSKTKHFCCCFFRMTSICQYYLHHEAHPEKD